MVEFTCQQIHTIILLGTLYGYGCTMYTKRYQQRQANKIASIIFIYLLLFHCLKLLSCIFIEYLLACLFASNAFSLLHVRCAISLLLILLLFYCWWLCCWFFFLILCGHSFRYVVWYGVVRCDILSDVVVVVLCVFIVHHNLCDTLFFENLSILFSRLQKLL